LDDHCVSEAGVTGHLHRTIVGAARCPQRLAEGERDNPSVLMMSSNEPTVERTCPDCKGTGQKQPHEQVTSMIVIRNMEVKSGASDDCETCGGTGRVAVPRSQP
jgi:hypothetical protein